MQEVLDSALPLVDFKIEYFRRQGSLETPQGKADAARAILDTLSRIDDAITAQMAVKDAAEKLGVDEKVLGNELRRMMQKSSGRARAVREEEKKPTGVFERLLLDLFRILVLYPDYRSEIFEYFRSSDLGDHRLRPVFEKLEAAHIEGNPITEADIYDRFAEQDHLARYIGAVLNKRTVDDELAVRNIIDHAPKELRIHAIEQEMQALKKRDPNVEDLKARSRGQELRRELFELKKSRAHIENPEQ
ncbi:DNA primase [bacterium BMS3Bbin04]|nr:DNA primase [bacterium BMS3Bbin04]